MNSNLYATIEEVLALSKQQAIKYAGLGIKSVTLSPDGTTLTFTFTDGSTSPISVESFLTKAIYDKYNRGKVDLAQNSELFESRTPAHYTDSANHVYSNTSVPSATSTKLAIDYLVSVALANKSFVEALSLETEANNTAILNVIKGDYITSDLNLTLDKSTGGVKINAKPLSDKIATTEKNIENLQNVVNQLGNTSFVQDAEIDDIIAGKYINASNGLTIVKNPAIGVMLTAPEIANSQQKSQKGVANGYAGLNQFAQVPLAQLPIATTTTGGVVKAGNNISIASDGTISTSGAGTNTSRVSYLLTEATTITDAMTNQLFKQRCSSKTDGRYSPTQSAISVNMDGATGSYQYVMSSITDADFITGTYSGIIANAILSYTNMIGTISFNVEYYKRSSNGSESLIGRSNNKIFTATTTTFDTIEVSTVLNDFTTIPSDKIVIRIYACRLSATPLTWSLIAEGRTPTQVVFNFASSGGKQTVSVNDVVGLPQIFGGTTQISDLSLSGQQFKLNDFMKLVNVDDSTTSYVRSSSLNGTGTVLSPFGTLATALASLDPTRTKINVMDSGTYSFPTTTNLSNLTHFYASQSDFTGNLKFTRNNSIYYVQNHTGDIEVSGTNISVIILGELYGNLTVLSKGTKIFVGWWDDLNRTIAGDVNIRVGSKLGKYTFGFTAIT